MVVLCQISYAQEGTVQPLKWSAFKKVTPEALDIYDFANPHENTRDYYLMPMQFSTAFAGDSILYKYYVKRQSIPNVTTNRVNVDYFYFTFEVTSVYKSYEQITPPTPAPAQARPVRYVQPKRCCFW